MGESYIHPFGSFGEEVAGVPFHHYWLELERQGLAKEIGTYSLAIAAARRHKFRPPVQNGGLASSYDYAYQFDAARFGPFMRDFAGASASRVPRVWWSKPSAMQRAAMSLPSS